MPLDISFKVIILKTQHLKKNTEKGKNMVCIV